MTAEPADADDGPGAREARDIELLAASLRADAADVEVYARVLTESLGDALPAGMVRVERDRSVRDRLSGRPGRVVTVTVSGRDRELVLHDSGRGTTASIVRAVRGVVIARDEVDLDAWLSALAAEVSAAARSSAASRTALERFLRT